MSGPGRTEARAGFRYVVLGSGRQGTAAAYDLARFGDAARVVMADARLDIARKAAARVNDLLGREVAEAARVTVDLVDRYDEAHRLHGDGTPHRLARSDPDDPSGPRARGVGRAPHGASGRGGERHGGVGKARYTSHHSLGVSRPGRARESRK